MTVYVQTDGSGGGGALNTGADISAAKDSELQQDIRATQAAAHPKLGLTVMIPLFHANGSVEVFSTVRPA
jgi:hypothetical protein